MSPTPKVTAPPHGVKVRMYRQGHGDCFLLAFKRSRGKRPYFVLIDCGRKKGSTPKDLEDKGIDFAGVLDALHADCGGVLDLVVVTHEHEDHVSGFPKPGDEDHPFSKFTVHDLWLAWTENGEDETANALREQYGDKLITLALAHEKLKALKGIGGQDDGLADEIADFLETETGHTDGAAVLREAALELDVAPGDLAGAPEEVFAATRRKKRSTRIRGKRYKERLAGLRAMAKGKITFIAPEDPPLPLPKVKGVRIYPFGPPRDEELLTSLDPRKREEFHIGPFAMGAPGAGMFAAFDGGAATATAPFAPRHIIPEAEIRPAIKPDEDRERAYLSEVYLRDEDAYRRIDGDWMGDAEVLALRLNSEVNNTSLVLCFELEESGRTLLFTGDAQRGSWVSWSDLSWQVDGNEVTARDLLGRCTFYKAGHHGSHNATLNGTVDSPHANLNWMALGAYAQEFVAMIPSNKSWAWGKRRPWRHPMKAIEQALHEKAKSRVMLIEPHIPERDPDFEGAEFDAMWDAFLAATTPEDFAIEHWVPDTKPGNST
ncbi:hypothetical protein C8N43_0767 [Litoreibacter ponti]|uniref:Metallo-beta-lactamase superfamily protein n=1 Tax=Litoreibacter ponti TaxID=1510457 RepID=A0A2T6BJ86_9RHOB|nr:hypothetical protein [Litoreibacter ponti]PTX56116.1 hypothetical protein C8N43_0767 [Litoreibacter ponti]